MKYVHVQPTVGDWMSENPFELHSTQKFFIPKHERSKSFKDKRAVI